MSAHPDVPGEPTTGTALLETATAAVQSFGPAKKIHQHLCAFHFYSHDMTRQVEEHHFLWPPERGNAPMPDIQ
ncbi:hypothetical protein Peur_021830 [Populus x canadensis]